MNVFTAYGFISCILFIPLSAQFYLSLSMFWRCRGSFRLVFLCHLIILCFSLSALIWTFGSTLLPHHVDFGACLVAAWSTILNCVLYTCALCVVGLSHRIGKVPLVVWLISSGARSREEPPPVEGELVNPLEMQNKMRIWITWLDLGIAFPWYALTLGLVASYLAAIGAFGTMKCDFGFWELQAAPPITDSFPNSSTGKVSLLQLSCIVIFMKRKCGDSSQLH
jgi:hypothetical protein